jgi:hypothetical protein
MSWPPCPSEKNPGAHGIGGWMGPSIILDIFGEDKNLVNLLRDKKLNEITSKREKSLAPFCNWTLDHPPNSLVIKLAVLSWLCVNIWINTYQ